MFATVKLNWLIPGIWDENLLYNFKFVKIIIQNSTIYRPLQSKHFQKPIKNSINKKILIQSNKTSKFPTPKTKTSSPCSSNIHGRFFAVHLEICWSLIIHLDYPISHLKSSKNYSEKKTWPQLITEKNNISDSLGGGRGIVKKITRNIVLFDFPKKRGI